MRKVVIILCLVAALVAMTVPAFAVGQGNGLVYWAPINFDRIHLDGVGQYDYPLNWIDSYSTNANPAQFVFDSNASIDGEAYYYSGDHSLTADFICPTEHIDIRADNAYFQPRALKSARYRYRFMDSSGNFLSVTRVSISFDWIYFEVNEVTQQFDKVIEPISVIYEYNDPDLYMIDIGELIADLILEHPDWNDNWYSALVAGLRVDFDFEMVDSSTPRVLVSWCGSQISERNDINFYLAQFGSFYAEPQPEPEVPPFDLGTWLSDTVGAFLTFEIFPGFSVDMIFYLILVIGIVLWFITVII